MAEESPEDEDEGRGDTSTLAELMARVGVDRESEQSYCIFSSSVEEEEEEEGEEEEEIEELVGMDNRGTIGQRLLNFLHEPRFAKFTFAGYFDTGAEGAVILRECLLMGLRPNCSFKGRQVTSLTFGHGLRIVNLRSYLPSGLFKMATAFRCLENWTWFPSHEIVRENINEVWDAIPEPAWWRDFNLHESGERALFNEWHASFGGRFDFNRQLVNHVYSRSMLIMKVAMSFSHEAMVMENELLHDKRFGLLAGANRVMVYGKLRYVSNNHPLSGGFHSMAGYAFWMFNRASAVRLPILQYHRHNNPAARSSMQELGYLEWLRLREEPDMQFALRGEQKCFEDMETGTKIYADGYVAGKEGQPDKIYEVMGCYHHGCTLCFPNGSPFEKLNQGSLTAANEVRRLFLSTFGTVVMVWSHSISQLLKDCAEFRQFYTTFCETDYRSFGWREGHTTGIVEPYGIYAHADSITKHWKKYCSDTYYQDAKVSQVDMNSNYSSTLMKINNPKLAAIVGQPAIPIPMGGLTTLFSPRIHAAGSCPPECWRGQCAKTPEEHEEDEDQDSDSEDGDEDGDQDMEPNNRGCSIARCHLSCAKHFNPDFFDQVSGMAMVRMVAPPDLFYPLVSISIDITPPADKGGSGSGSGWNVDNEAPEDDEGRQPESREPVKESVAQRKIVNYLALCRACAAATQLCCTNEQECSTRGDGEKLHNHAPSCKSGLNWFTPCKHTEDERAFDKVLPLNELAYVLREGYTVLKYHSIRYFSRNVFWEYDDFMGRINLCKVRAKGLPSDCDDDPVRLRQTLKAMRLELPELRCSGPDVVLRGQFQKNPVLAKLFKLVSCLIIGKLAMDNDRKFTRLVHSFGEFYKLQRDDTVNIESYSMLNPHTLLVTMGAVEGGDRSVTRSNCLLLSSMITAAARVNMFKVMYHLYRNEGYLTLYLGVDSLVVVPFVTWAQPIQEVLPIDDLLAGYFGYQHESVESVVAYGRNRYSILNKETRKVEFKFSGLSGVRNAGINDFRLGSLHRDIATVLMKEVKSLPLAQARVEIAKDYMSIIMRDEAFSSQNFHILDLKRGFFPSSILRDYCFTTKAGAGRDDPSLFPLVMSYPLGYQCVAGDFFADNVAYLQQDNTNVNGNGHA
jgi:hypothetical protein